MAGHGKAASKLFVRSRNFTVLTITVLVISMKTWPAAAAGVMSGRQHGRRSFGRQASDHSPQALPASCDLPHGYGCLATWSGPPDLGLEEIGQGAAAAEVPEFFVDAGTAEQVEDSLEDLGLDAASVVGDLVPHLRVDAPAADRDLSGRAGSRYLTAFSTRL